VMTNGFGSAAAVTLAEFSAVAQVASAVAARASRIRRTNVMPPGLASGILAFNCRRPLAKGE